MKKRVSFYAVFLTLVFGLAAFAGTFAESYNGLVAAPTELVVNATGADSLVIGASPLAGRAVVVKQNPTCYARVDFSGSAADTVKLHCNLWLKRGSTWTYLGSYEATVTAGAVTDAAGDNVGTNLAGFDTGAATHVEVRNAAPSAGSVDVTVWVGAADPQGG